MGVVGLLPLSALAFISLAGVFRALGLPLSKDCGETPKVTLGRPCFSDRDLATSLHSCCAFRVRKDGHVMTGFRSSGRAVKKRDIVRNYLLTPAVADDDISMSTFASQGVGFDFLFVCAPSSNLKSWTDDKDEPQQDEGSVLRLLRPAEGYFGVLVKNTGCKEPVTSPVPKSINTHATISPPTAQSSSPKKLRVEHINLRPTGHEYDGLFDDLDEKSYHTDLATTSTERTTLTTPIASSATTEEPERPQSGDFRENGPKSSVEVNVRINANAQKKNGPETPAEAEPKPKTSFEDLMLKLLREMAKERLRDSDTPTKKVDEVKDR